MPTTIGTSTAAGATAWGGDHKLLFASDGTAFAAYNDGTNWVFRTASSPYTSWSSATTIAAVTFIGFDAVIDSSDHIHVAYKGGSGGAYYITDYVLLTKSGTTWTVGTPSNVSGTTDTGGADLPVQMVLDQSYGTNGRRYVVSYSAGYGIWYSTNGTSWSVSSTSRPYNALGVYSHSEPVYFNVGKYLLYVREEPGYRGIFGVLDTTGTLTSWSSETNISGGPSGPQNWAAVQDSNGLAIIAYDGATGGVAAYTFDPVALTATADTTLGASASDIDPTLVNIGGDVYAVWSAYSAASNYGLSYAKWNATTKTWGSATALEASGANRVWTSVGAKGTTLLAWVWTEGTGSPYNVRFDSLSLGGGTAGNASASPASLVLNAPVAVATSNAAAAVTAATLTITAPAATATAGSSGTASPAAASLTATAPTVIATSNATATVMPATLTLTAQPATASAGGSATAAVSPASLVLAAQVVTATGNAIAGAMPATLSLTPGAATASGVTTAIVAAVTLTLAAQAVSVRADATVVVAAATLLLTAQGVTANGGGQITPFRTFIAGTRTHTFVAGTPVRTFKAGSK